LILPGMLFVPAGEMMIRIMKHFVFTAALALLMGGLTQRADASGVVDFEEFVHGEILADQLKVSDGISITAVNFSEPFNIAAIFNTQFAGATPDPDLIGPAWAGGNLAALNVELGNAVILATDDELSAPGILATPNDEGDRPAGEIIFEFASLKTMLGFDLIDVESIVAEDGSVDFYLDGELLDSVGFDEFVTMGNEFYDPTVEYGNNHANRIAPISLSDLTLSDENADAEGFNRVVFSMGGSGAIDTINFIPEPTTLSLLALGGVALIRRRRSA